MKIDKKTITLIAKLIRAKMGLPLTDEVFSGLINVKDIRERTRLIEQQIYEHSYMRELAIAYPDLFNLYWDVADMEDTYFISKDGEGRKEAILMQQARTQAQMPLAIALPQVQTQPLKEEKKGFFSRGKKEQQPS